MTRAAILFFDLEEDRVAHEHACKGSEYYATIIEARERLRYDLEHSSRSKADLEKAIQNVTDILLEVKEVD